MSDSLPSDVRASADIEALPAWVRAGVLKVREALANDDLEEAYHHLYVTFTPTFCYDPWKALENQACGCSNHE